MIAGDDVVAVRLEVRLPRVLAVWAAEQSQARGETMAGLVKRLVADAKVAADGAARGAL